MNKLLTAIVVTTLTLGSAALAQDDANRNGLVKTNESAFKDAWVAPGIDFSKYDKILVAPPEFGFREVDKRGGLERLRSSKGEFPVEQRDREKFVSEVTKMFDEELARTHGFEFVNEPGEGVLILQGGLADIVSTTPPQTTGRGNVYVSSVGAATLVLQATDSRTGEVLFRAEERKRIERPGREMIDVNNVATWAEVRRWARHWATKLRKDLDAVHG